MSRYVAQLSTNGALAWIIWVSPVESQEPLKAENFLWLVAEKEVRETGNIRESEGFDIPLLA